MRSASASFPPRVKELAIEDVVDQVGVDFDAGKIESAERRDAKVANARGRGADENDLVFECAGGNFFCARFGE